MRGPISTFNSARRLRRDMSLPETVLWPELPGEAVGRGKA